MSGLMNNDELKATHKAIDEIRRLKTIETRDEAYSEAMDEIRQKDDEIERLKIKILRAADELEDSPINHASGCPVSGICVCDDGKERVNIVSELRKAAE